MHQPVMSLMQVVGRERQILHLFQLMPTILRLELSIIQSELIPVDRLVWDVLTPKMEHLADLAAELAPAEDDNPPTLELPVVRDPRAW